MSAKIEGVPDGYELVKFAKPVTGDFFISSDGQIERANFFFTHVRAIVRKIEPSYAERQAEWVKQNDLKVGDKVKVLRMFEEGERDFECHANKDMLKHIGEVAIVRKISDGQSIVANHEKTVWHWPYFVLEKVIPTTRPMTRDEFIAAWKARGFCPLVDNVGGICTVLQVGDFTNYKVRVDSYGWMSMEDAASLSFFIDNAPLSVTE